MLWFDALLKWETVALLHRDRADGCDLMLYWNEKQWTSIATPARSCCDLMLYWNEKQLVHFKLRRVTVVIWCSIEMRNSDDLHRQRHPGVVIWCSIEMRNSFRAAFRAGARVVIWCSIEMRNSIGASQNNCARLWFDALLKWETVRESPRVRSPGCDLMLYWNEKQYGQLQRRRLPSCDLMLYWNEKQYIECNESLITVVIWCSIEMRNSKHERRYTPHDSCDLMLYWNEKQFTEWRPSLSNALWFDALLKWETVQPCEMKKHRWLWFDALLKWETVAL